MIFNFITSYKQRRIFELTIYLLIFVFIVTINGCTTTNTKEVTAANLPYEVEYSIVKVIMKNGLVINLKDKTAMYFREYQGHNNVIAYPGGNIIELKDALSVTVEKKETDVGLSILASFGILVAVLALIFVIVLAFKDSCPFIYSFDGDKYVFDAEPYGGAVAEGLKKTDYSRLEYLKPVDGKYKLLMRNEADETQHTDEMNMIVVDHPLETEVASDLTGNFTVFKKIYAPLTVTDENDVDVTSFLIQRDQVQWQTKLPTDTSFLGKNLRNELTFKFPKPKNAKNVKLLVNAGTALWGGYMIKEMLNLRGNKVDDWYKNINNGGNELMKLYSFMYREELYTLKVNVNENNNWVTRGLISAGGPFIDEDRIVNLDISNVTGDTLFLKLNPPYGYWNIDFVGAMYDEFPQPIIKEIPMSFAKDEMGNDLRELLKKMDGKYYDMPDSTSIANIYFDVPVQKENTIRTLFLKTSGYYDIHLKKDKPEQTELIEKIMNNPGLIIEYSMKLYLEYTKSLGFNGN